MLQYYWKASIPPEFAKDYSKIFIDKATSAVITDILNNEVTERLKSYTTFKDLQDIINTFAPKAETFRKFEVLNSTLELLDSNIKNLNAKVDNNQTALNDKVNANTIKIQENNLDLQTKFTSLRDSLTEKINFNDDKHKIRTETLETTLNTKIDTLNNAMIKKVENNTLDLFNKIEELKRQYKLVNQLIELEDSNLEQKIEELKKIKKQLDDKINEVNRVLNGSEFNVDTSLLTIERLKNQVNEKAQLIVDTLNEKFNQLKSRADNIDNEFQEAFNNAESKIRNEKTRITNLADKFKDDIKIIETELNQFLEQINNRVQTLKDTINNRIQTVETRLNEKIQELNTLINSELPTIFQSMQQKVEEFSGNINNKKGEIDAKALELMDLINSKKSIIDARIEEIKQQINQFFSENSAQATIINQKFEEAKTAFNEKLEKVKGFTTKLEEIIRDYDEQNNQNIILKLEKVVEFSKLDLDSIKNIDTVFKDFKKEFDKFKSKIENVPTISEELGNDKTYSNIKINELLNSKSQINDSEISDNSTYSSRKINEIVPKISNDLDDNNVYSNNKVNELLNSKTNNDDFNPLKVKVEQLESSKVVIDDLNAATNKVYSSSKIVNLLNSKAEISDELGNDKTFSNNKINELLNNKANNDYSYSKNEADLKFLNITAQAEDSKKLGSHNPNEFILKTELNDLLPPQQQPDLSEYAKKSEIPSIENLALKSESIKKDNINSLKDFQDPTNENSLYLNIKKLIPLLNINNKSVNGESLANIVNDTINFDDGINFIGTMSSFTGAGASLTMQAENHQKIENLGKSGLIFIENQLTGFNNQFVLMNPDDFNPSASSLFSYFINPVNKKIYLQFVGNLV